MVKTKRRNHRKLKKRIKSRKRHKSRKQHKLKKHLKMRKHLKTRRRRKLKYRGGSLWSSKKKVERKAQNMRQKANKIHQKLAVPYRDAEGKKTRASRRIPQKRAAMDAEEKFSNFFKESAPKMPNKGEYDAFPLPETKSFFRNPFKSRKVLAPPLLRNKGQVRTVLTVKENTERLKKLRELRKKNEKEMKEFENMGLFDKPMAASEEAQWIREQNKKGLIADLKNENDMTASQEARWIREQNKKGRDDKAVPE